MRFLLLRVAAAALFALTGSSSAWAEISHYEFQLVTKEAKAGDAVLDVRLVDTTTGKPVPDAVIFAKRIDMAPDGMETMTSSIEQSDAPEPGVYRFKAKLTMAGGWRLSLGAKVQGETGTLEGRLILKARP